jgi:hypothetical protein
LKYLVLAVGVAAIAAITFKALERGMDGVLVSLAFAGIGTLAGIALRIKPLRRKRKK